MNNRFQANEYQLAFEIANSKMLAIENMVTVYMNILGCSSTKDIMFIEFKIVQEHINASD